MFQMFRAREIVFSSYFVLFARVSCWLVLCVLRVLSTRKRKRDVCLSCYGMLSTVVIHSVIDVFYRFYAVT